MIGMSKWTEIRDDIEAEISEMKIDEQVKQTVTQKLYDVVLPSLRSLGNGFTDALKEQSKNETGWCKVRDAIILPTVIQSALWLIDLMLRMTIKQTTGVDVSAS